MWIRAITAAAAAIGLMIMPGCEREEERGGAGSPRVQGDHAFLASACQINLTEVEAGRLAMEKGGHEDVKRFGHHMMEDHTQWNEDLVAFAKKKGVALPGQPDEAQKKAVADLAKLSGTEFDKKYVGMMVADHAKAVALFEDKAKRAQDPDVRAWAEKTVPKLREHLNMARDLSSKLGQPE